MVQEVKWTQMERDLCGWLSTFSSETIEFRNSYQAIIGFPSDGFRSDGMLTDGETIIAVEVEAGQTHPDTNTGKYWLLYERQKCYRRIILFHIYTPRFDSYGWRKELAEFYVEQMKSTVPVDYILLDFRNASDYRRVLTDTQRVIRERVDKEFGTICEQSRTLRSET